VSVSVRTKSEGDIYHIIIRGTGRQIIFEDGADRTRFLEMFASLCQELDVGIYAWCLMANHAHMLLHADLQLISACMQRLETGYAKYFNKRHDRIGGLFQGRFTSVPIESDTQLVTTVRYIHQNPVKAGSALENAWSSYNEYVNDATISDTAFVTEIMGGTQALIEFHREQDVSSDVEPRHRMSDEQAMKVMEVILNGVGFYELRHLAKSERDDYLHRMKNAGVTIRQIERATSIGRGIVSKA